MSWLGTTPSQTVGPFFAIGLPWPDGQYVVDEGTPGAIWIEGYVYDGNGDPIPDALVETWQADADGRFNHPADPRGRAADFRGFARAPCDDDGRYRFLTVKPGPVPGPDGTTQAPHIDVSIFARGMLNRVVTRIYFADEEEANAADPVLQAVEDAARRTTLIAQPTEAGYRHDFRLQGEDETVFFAV
ncbi:MAG TPA: protocatechuate 3,4-dioxygenase subunit alpha [Solirubrobacteraceae bacterium]|jgi:protocatechuate 3,4-dioxygenase alpha subunit